MINETNWWLLKNSTSGHFFKILCNNWSNNFKLSSLCLRFIPPTAQLVRFCEACGIFIEFFGYFIILATNNFHVIKIKSKRSRAIAFYHNYGNWLGWSVYSAKLKTFNNRFIRVLPATKRISNLRFCCYAKPYLFNR